MVKKTVRKVESKVPDHCHMCGGKNCNCAKTKAATMLLMAVALLGYAGGFLSLQLAAGVVGVLIGLGGLMMLTKH